MIPNSRQEGPRIALSAEGYRDSPPIARKRPALVKPSLIFDSHTKEKQMKKNKHPETLKDAYYTYLGDAAQPHFEYACRLMGELGRSIDRARHGYIRIYDARKQMQARGGKMLSMNDVAAWSEESWETANRMVSELQAALALAYGFREAVGYSHFAANLFGFKEKLEENSK